MLKIYQLTNGLVPDVRLELYEHSIDTYPTKYAYLVTLYSNRILKNSSKNLHPGTSGPRESGNPQHSFMLSGLYQVMVGGYNRLLARMGGLFAEGG